MAVKSRIIQFHHVPSSAPPFRAAGDWGRWYLASDNAAVERLPQARSSQAVQISADLSGRFRFRIGTRRASWSCQIGRGRVLTDTCIFSKSLQFDTLKGCRTWETSANFTTWQVSFPDISSFQFYAFFWSILIYCDLLGIPSVLQAGPSCCREFGAPMRFIPGTTRATLDWQGFWPRLSVDKRFNVYQLESWCDPFLQNFHIFWWVQKAVFMPLTWKVHVNQSPLLKTQVVHCFIIFMRVLWLWIIKSKVTTVLWCLMMSSWLCRCVAIRCFKTKAGFACRSISQQSCGCMGGLLGNKTAAQKQHSYWKWQFIVDFPIKNSDFP